MHRPAPEPISDAAVPPSSPALLLRIADVCDQLSLSRAAVQRLLTTGELRSVQIGRSRRVLYADLLRFVAQLGDDIQVLLPTER